MPTAVIDLEVDQLATSIENLGRYEQALVLLRLQGRPIGQAYIPVVDGRIGAAALEAAFAEVDVYETWVHHVARHLDVHPYQPPLTATVAICTRDRPDDLRHCLDAVLRLPDDGQEILVIDNNPSTDATREVVAAYPKVRYVREDRRGLDNARNRALREARHDIVAFVDDDARPEPDWLRAILRNFDGPLVMCVTGLVMPVELETEAQEWFERYSRFGRGYRRRVFDYRNISPLDGGRVGAGASMALRRELIDEIGPFDPALDAGTRTQSGGDTEMFIRILNAGYQIVYDPAILSWHRHRRTWPELIHAIYGYGVGTYALWTQKLITEKEWGVLKRATIWFWGYQLPALIRSLLKRPETVPSDILLAELRGCLQGPGAYLAARRSIHNG